MSPSNPWVRVLLPGTDTTALRLNRGRLGQHVLGGAYRPGSHLNTDRLAAFVLGGGWAPAAEYVDIAAHATHITARRGMAGRSAGLLTGDVGLLTVRITADTPRQDEIRPGTPITVGIGAQTWWTGRVTTRRHDLHRLGDGREYVTIEATDAVSRLAAITIGAIPSTLVQVGQIVGDLCDEPDERPDPLGRVPSRFGRILDHAPEIRWEKTAARGPLHWSYTGAVTQYGAVGEPATAAELLDIACATLRAMWWITATGEVRISEPDPTAPPVAELTDQPGGLSYLDLAAAIGPDDLVTRVKLTTRQSEPGVLNPQGQPSVIEYWWEWADPTLVATWGDHRLDLTIGADAMGGYEHALGAWYAAPWYTPPGAADALRIDSVTVRDAPDIDVGDVITITHQARTAIVRVRGVTRTVTPGPGRPRITTTYTLTERS